jgi:hypothetical protein
MMEALRSPKRSFLQNGIIQISNSFKFQGTVLKDRLILQTKTVQKRSEFTFFGSPYNCQMRLLHGVLQEGPQG